MNQANNPFGIPGLDSAGAGSNPMLQGLDMLNKMWGGNLGTPGTAGVPPFGPGFKPEDLDKRIAELRAVENWLRVNQAMLQSTIQGLEVQRATFATLQSFVTPPAEGKAGADASAPVQAWWNMVQDQFGRIAQAAAAGTPSPARPAADTAADDSAPVKAARKTPAKKAAGNGPA